MLILLSLLPATPTLAYVGPGLGLGVIGALVGGLLALLMAIVGLVWYPIKRMLRKARNPAGKDQNDRAAPTRDQEPEPGDGA